MILNDCGAFQPNEMIKIIPYKHHLSRRMWMVFVEDGDFDIKINHFAVFAKGNEEAAEIGYNSYLHHIKIEEKVLKENIEIAEKSAAKDKKFNVVVEREKGRYEEWLTRKKHLKLKEKEKEDG